MRGLRYGWMGMAGASVLLAGCVPAPREAAISPPRPVPPPPIARPQTLPAAAPTWLAREIAGLALAFQGDVGIAVTDVRGGWIVAHNADRPMPQQSVSKLWVAITLLDAVDRGRLRLDDPVTVTRADLTLFHQPIRALIGPAGFRTTLRELFIMAMTRSDNTANDVLLRQAGGPAAVRAMVAAKGLGAIGFGEGERLLQSRIAGLEWRPEFSIGNGFQVARAALPMDVRRAAMDRYLASPMDGASAAAIARALARLERGELLSPASTALLLATMRDSRTGPQRLRGGLGPGWTLAHKTGTGQDLAGMVAGYNDVGVLTSPTGRSYGVAVMIASTRQPIPTRQRLMNEVVRAVVRHEDAIAGLGGDLSRSRGAP